MASAKPLAVGSVPTEASSRGSLNESTPAAQRSPDGAHIPKTDGPRINVNGAYEPAEYKKGKVTRRDR